MNKQAYISLKVQASGRQSLRIGTTDSLRGPQGPPGISPDVTVTPISGGHRVTIEDADGVETFDVLNGRDGADGGMEPLTNLDLEEMLT